jgi:Flp pilus assembly protein TadD
MHRPPSVTFVTLAVVAMWAGGCAAHQTPASAGLAGKLVTGVDGPGGFAWPTAGEAVPASTATDPVDPAPEMSREPRLKQGSLDAELVEVSDPGLRAALGTARATPGAESFRGVAAEYRRLGVFDQAWRYLTDALTADPADAATHDALARLWRDWGVPGEGLSEAYRAVALGSDRPSAHNTLATVLFTLGHVEAAEASLERAVALDDRATYARSNLCYAAFTRGDESRALEHCRAALELDPAFAAARNNLALVHAAAGRWTEARTEFIAAAADEAVGLYNLGMVFLASGQYERAADTFDAAHERRPSLHLASERSREARRLAEAAASANNRK